MVTPIVAAGTYQATRYAVEHGVKQWVAVTPDNYEAVLPGLTFHNHGDLLWAASDWVFPPDMLAAIRARFNQ